MKKVSALLLTAVLGSSMVFAGIGGTVETTYNYDLEDSKTFFNNDVSDVTADFSFTTEGEAISEGDIHAEISADLTILVEDLTGDSGFTGFSVDDDNLSAKIVGPNWYVDITGPADVADYASDVNTDDDGEVFHDWSFAEIGLDGLEMGYTYEEGKTVVISVGSNLDFKNTDAENYLAITSPLYMLGEGVSVEAGLGVQNTNKKFDFGGGMQMTVADEDMGYSIVTSVDMGYVAARDAYNKTVAEVPGYWTIDETAGPTYGDNIYIAAVPETTEVVAAKDAKFDIEASMVGTYSIATVEAYFATTAVFDIDDTDADEGDADEYTFDLATGTNLLSAKLTLDLSEFAPVSVYAGVFGMNVEKTYDTDLEAYVTSTTADSEYRMNAGADYTIDMDGASLVASLSGGLNFETTADWKIGGELAYTPAMPAYTATVGVDYYNARKGDTVMKPSASISTDTMINGATLTFEYKDAMFNLDDDTQNDNGAIVLTCEIEL